MEGLILLIISAEVIAGGTLLFSIIERKKLEIYVGDIIFGLLCPRVFVVLGIVYLCKIKIYPPKKKKK